MTDENQTGSKVHYICQTYVEKKSARGGQAGLQIGKTFQYSAASEAEARAERESRSADCVGADAYMIVEDTDSGELGAPTFIARFGTVPDEDGN